MIPRPPRSTLFPTRRSSDLKWEREEQVLRHRRNMLTLLRVEEHIVERCDRFGILLGCIERAEHQAHAVRRLAVDRKSTRLNSSHGYISYAVFCLKKKIQHNL